MVYIIGLVLVGSLSAPAEEEKRKPVDKPRKEEEGSSKGPGGGRWRVREGVHLRKRQGN